MSRTDEESERRLTVKESPARTVRKVNNQERGYSGKWGEDA